MNNAEMARYSRHILLEDIGIEGQEKIKRAKVLVVGAGGLGSPALMYLASAGVGVIGVIDGDVVDVTNLQRQVIHQTKDIGVAKVLSAREKMLAINPHIVVNAMHSLLTAENAEEVIRHYDFIIDATDNFDVKFLINDTCVALEKAFSYGGILRYEGQTFTHLPGTADLRSIYGDAPSTDVVPKASEVGVLGAIAGMLGTIQAAEALKYITGVGELLTDKLLTFDARTMDFHKFTFQ